LSVQEECPLCGKRCKYKHHEKDCVELSGLHIECHQIMQNYLIGKLRKYHAKEFKADTGWKGGYKPDVTLSRNGIKYYLDIGFSNDAEIYFKVKRKKFEKSE